MATVPFMRPPDLKDTYQVGDIVEAFCDHIKGEEAFRPPYILKDASKHPQGKHVEQEVCEASMHEHIRYKLPGTEIG